MWGLMKNQASEMKAAMNKENARFMAQHGQVWDPKKMVMETAQAARGLMGMWAIWIWMMPQPQEEFHRSVPVMHQWLLLSPAVHLLYVR